MISSMTGFGRGCAQTPAKRIKVEIKSLNSKQPEKNKNESFSKFEDYI